MNLTERIRALVFKQLGSHPASYILQREDIVTLILAFMAEEAQRAAPTELQKEIDRLNVMLQEQSDDIEQMRAHHNKFCSTGDIW